MSNTIELYIEYDDQGVRNDIREAYKEVENDAYIEYDNLGEHTSLKWGMNITIYNETSSTEGFIKKVVDIINRYRPIVNLFNVSVIGNLSACVYTNMDTNIKVDVEWDEYLPYKVTNLKLSQKAPYDTVMYAHRCMDNFKIKLIEDITKSMHHKEILTNENLHTFTRVGISLIHEIEKMDNVLKVEQVYTSDKQYMIRVLSSLYESDTLLDTLINRFDQKRWSVERSDDGYEILVKTITKKE